MSKLTEIKELFQIVKEEDPNAKMAYVKIDVVEYLLSLLEEKDKALAFYADKKNYETVYENDDDPFSLMSERVLIDGGTIARKALNTSSNNQGETI